MSGAAVCEPASLGPQPHATSTRIAPCSSLQAPRRLGWGIAKLTHAATNARNREPARRLLHVLLHQSDRNNNEQDGKLDLKKAKTLSAPENLLQGRCFEPAPERSRAQRAQTRSCLAESCVLRAACCVLRATDAAAAAQQRERRSRFLLATAGFEPWSLDSKMSAIPLYYGVAYPTDPAN